MEGGPAVLRTALRILQRRGDVAAIVRPRGCGHARGCARAQAFCRTKPKRSEKFCDLHAISQLAHRLSTVASVAKRLQIFGVEEQRAVAAMRPDVIDLGCAHARAALLPAHAAERLSGQLRQAQRLPARMRIQPVPGFALFALRLFPGLLVLLAVSARHQLRTSRMAARPQWFVRHGNKKSLSNTKATDTITCVGGSGV